MDRVGTIYKRTDDRNYPIAILLLMFAGFTGAHRFYLNDFTIAWCYLGGLAASLLIGFATISFTLPLLYFGLASVALFCEFLYLIYRFSNR